MSTFLANQAVDMEVLPELALFDGNETIDLPTPPVQVVHDGVFYFMVGLDTAVTTVRTLAVLTDGKMLYEISDMEMPFSSFLAPVHNFVLLALAGNDDVIGSNFDDNLIALGGDDGVRGRRGNDTLNGGLGNDSLTGGQGEDRFLFDTALAANIDAITDFSHKEGDRIILDDLVFAEVGVPGVLRAKAFNIGKKAADKSDRIIYNEKKGALFYDHDGKGGDAQIQFAILDKKTDLSASDILVI